MWFCQNFFWKIFLFLSGKSISIFFIWVLENGRFGQVDKFISDYYVAGALLPRLSMQRKCNVSSLPDWIYSLLNPRCW
jgi:hypothetical protein